MKNGMQTAVIFGANGQDGKYLYGLLKSKGYKVVGVSRSGPWINADVADFNAVRDIIQNHQPDLIFQLAANSATSHALLLENHATICTGAINVLECTKEYAPHARVFIPGSGLQFKNNGRPIKETDEFDASSAYSVSRISTVYAARYFRNLGIKAYVGYLFNHESPERPERHLSRRIANFVKNVMNGNQDVLAIGDLSVRKEWAYAGDIANGMYALVTQDKVFEATIGSGIAYSIQDWIEECFKLAGLDWRPYVVEKAGFTPEYKILVSDPTTIFSLGWKPEVSFSALAKMMLDS